ncbi:HAD family hydrolase [Altericroceibacterium xinjiangense]|uniref:HAD family hydrolase n=1 Tax=Altericroceibacterium xinjiangense TaxID=762261 RepID=UPI000F7EAF3D|nr:HAD family phosphatase [Altericroceibacterium xinjiangense]
MNRKSSHAGSVLPSEASASEVPGAAVFDVGRVLYEWDLRCLFGKLIADRDELERFLGAVVTEEWHFQHDAGRDLAEMVAERKTRFPEHAALLDAYATRFSETIPGPVNGTHSLVERLAERGVPLFALTNFAAPFWDEFSADKAVFRHFGDIVVSGVEKCVKPNPEIYAVAERRFGYPPPDLFFIDDNAANVEAARARGWRAHHFTDAARLEQELIALGLL